MTDDIETAPESPDREEDPFEEEVVTIPIDGVLDLHTFSPKEVRDLLDDYLEECARMGILDVRVIHGKGKGILRDRVRRLLSRHPLVEGWSEADLDAGGWGATLVRLKGPKGG